MGKLLCEKNYGTFGVEMRAYGQKLVKFCTHTHAAKLVVEIKKARKNVESLERNLAETIAQSVDKMNLLFT